MGTPTLGGMDSLDIIDKVTEEKIRSSFEKPNEKTIETFMSIKDDLY